MDKVDQVTRAMLDLKTEVVLAAIDVDSAVCTVAFDPGPAQRHAVEAAFQKLEDRILDLRRAYLHAPLDRVSQ
jgi:hypothetical protein